MSVRYILRTNLSPFRLSNLCGRTPIRQLAAPRVLVQASRAGSGLRSLVSGLWSLVSVLRSGPRYGPRSGPPLLSLTESWTKINVKILTDTRL